MKGLPALPEKVRMKTCSKCKEAKPAIEFGKNRWHKDGIHHQCRTCSRLRDNSIRPSRKKWLKNNPNYYQNYYQTNPDKANDPDKGRKRFKERKRWMDEYKLGLKCVECGQDHPACLEFHHNDPTQKEITIGQKYQKWSIKHLLEEIKKCTVLCSNCHRKFHWNQRRLDRTLNGHAMTQDLATAYQ